MLHDPPLSAMQDAAQRSSVILLVLKRSMCFKVVKIGKTIATVKVELRNTRSGRLVASGRHMKFLSDKEEQSVTKDLPRSRL